MPFPGSRPENSRSPGRSTAQKVIFIVCKFQRSLFFVSKTPWVAVQRLFWIVFGWLKGILGPSKLWIPYSGFIKYKLFKALLSGHLLEPSWKNFGSP